MRLPPLLAGCLLALTLVGGAAAYPWPVRPFYRQHPIRANFGDPRTIFRDGLYADGAAGPGGFRFHNGIDIVAPDGTTVYPVVSGTVRLISGDAVAVDTTEGRTFLYYHLIPTVLDGELVSAQRSALGFIRQGAGHVHLSELRHHRIWNPLARGGIAPYADLTDPVVRSIYVRRWNSLALVDPEAACGRIALAADAHDTQAIPVMGSFADFPVSPALLTWSMARRDDARPIAAATGRDDFRGTLPPSRDFWHVYARGTYQNRPVFGRRLYSMPGVFLFQLTRDGLDTRTLPNGLYTVTVRAQDIDGNFGSLTRELRIENDAATPTGCRAPAPLPPSPLPPQPPLRP